MSDNPIAYASVKSGSTSKCCKMLGDMIKNELRLFKDQIVSISIHDSRVHHGDLEAVVFYREKSIVADSQPTESIKYNIVERDEDTDWADIQNEILMNVNGRSQQTIGISSTFRQVGDEKISCSFHIAGRGATVYQQVFTDKSSWVPLLDQAEQFLNDYITPGEFLGITLYEDEHPLMEREAVNGKRNVIIYHTAGQKIAPIKELKADLVGKIYTLDVMMIPEEKTWDNLYTQCTTKMNESGQSTGHYVATATCSDDNSKGHQLGVLVKYDLNMAENLKDLRGGGCCAIF